MLEFQNKKGQKELRLVVYLFHFIFHLLSSPVCLIARGKLYLKCHFLPLQTPLPSCNLLGPIPRFWQEIMSGSTKFKRYCTSILRFQPLKCYNLIGCRAAKLGTTKDNVLRTAKKEHKGMFSICIGQKNRLMAEC